MSSTTKPVADTFQYVVDVCLQTARILANAAILEGTRIDKSRVDLTALLIRVETIRMVWDVLPPAARGEHAERLRDLMQAAENEIRFLAGPYLTQHVARKAVRMAARVAKMFDGGFPGAPASWLGAFPYFYLPLTIAASPATPRHGGV